MFYLAQLVGVIALVFLVLSYLQTKRTKYLLSQIFANIFFAIQFVMLGGISGASGTLVSVLRTIIFDAYEQKEKRAPLFILIIVYLIVIITMIAGYDGLYTLIPGLLVMLYGYAMWQRNLKVTYTIGMIGAICWVPYYIVILSYSGLLCSILEIIFSIIGLNKLKKQGYKYIKEKK